MNESETVELLRDIKQILSMICLSNISNLKEKFLKTEKDQKVYDLCSRRTAEEIAEEMPDLGYSSVYERVSTWEKNGLLISEQAAGGRGRPKKYYINVESFFR